MRSHAMKGKNAGKTLHRRSRVNRGLTHQCTQMVPLSVVECGNDEASDGDPLQRLACTALRDKPLSFSFSIDATPQSQYVINQCELIAVYP